MVYDVYMHKQIITLELAGFKIVNKYTIHYLGGQTTDIKGTDF